MTTNHKRQNANRKNTSRESSERITAKTLAAVLLSRWAADIKEGKSPWARPCYTLQALAISHDTGRRYSLSNQCILDAEKPTEYTTFIQAKKEGGHVIKGAKASYINYFRELKKQNGPDEAQPDDEPETDEAQPARRMLFAQGVFPLDQTEGIKPRWEYPQTMSPAAARARVDFWREKFPQIFERTETTEAALFIICKTWDEANATKPEEENDEAAAAFNTSSIIAAALAAALIVKATGEETTAPAPTNEMAEALNDHPMRIYGIIARAEKAARAVLKMEEEPKPVKLPQPEKTEAEQETTPAAVPQVLTYEKPQPVTTCAPLRAVLIDDDDDDETQYCVCTLAGAGF